SFYWRNGFLFFNAKSGVDIAFWDIKGKRANMPFYQLLGGKVRFGADLYFHASGRDFQQVEEIARCGMELGYRRIRVQGAVPGLAIYGARGATAGGGEPTAEVIGPTNPKAIWDSAPYLKMFSKLLDHMRTKFGEEVELLHDVHERVTLPQAIQLCKD